MAVPREPYPVVDVFAGPGGLGEGFAALRGKSYSARFDSVVSIERDESAHQTLLLRHFLRRFPYQQFPDDYYRYLRADIGRDELYRNHREEFLEAKKSALKISLGPDSHVEVKRIISRKLKGQQKWALVGGPPCQAYSIVGRSRMMGDPDFEEDERHTLYLEYLKIIIDHQPPVFVMENVKGLLSARINGKPAITRIVRDLSHPIEKAGYGAIWHGQKAWNGVAILARDTEPLETRRGLPGDTSDAGSRYIEAAVQGLVIGCLYLPNGNPAPGPKFEGKLGWFRRLQDYATELLELGVPVILAGDYNVMPTDLDVYAPERWRDDALFRLEVREAYRVLVEQGWTDALRTLHPEERIYTFWKYFRNAFARDAGLRIDHLLLSPSLTPRLIAAEVDRAVRGWDKASDHAPVWIEISD